MNGSDGISNWEDSSVIMTVGALAMTDARRHGSRRSDRRQSRGPYDSDGDSMPVRIHDAIQTAAYFVPKIRSPASPRPGQM